MTVWKAASVGITLALMMAGQDQNVFRSDTRLVEVEAVVRDGKGPIQGLTQSDFQLFDNGKLQKISTFGVVTSKGAGSAGPEAIAAGGGASRTELPVTATVIFINNRVIAFSDQVQAEKRVAEVFHKLPPREPVAVYVLNQSLRIMADFTEDPTRIAKALDAAWGEPPQTSGAWCVPPVYPALEKMANEMASLPSRKNLIWFANYFPVSKPSDNGPCASLAYFAMLRAIKALNAANVAVYPIRASGVVGPPAYSAGRGRAPSIAWNASQGPSGIDGMFWADQTGGTAAQNTDVGFAALRALDDSQVTYSLGFYPETLDGTYHDLKVKVNRKGVDVRSRAGYLASLPVDLSTSTNADASMQAPYFYTGTDRARVHVALETLPTGMPFQKKGNSFHGQIDMAGTTLHTNGGEAARFEESLDVNMESQQQADAFTQTPFHYERQFLLLAGNYVFQMTVGVGRSKGKVTLPLNIEPWRETAFGIGGIAFCTEGKSPDGDAKLVAGGREFALAGGNRFRKSDHVYFYTEVYEPNLVGANPPTLSLEYRVVDRNNGEAKQDSGPAGIAGYVHPGNAVVPFATALPVAALEPGLYRLEVRAGHSLGPDVVIRSADFEVR
jgi:VWFA-related protein